MKSNAEIDENNLRPRMKKIEVQMQQASRKDLNVNQLVGLSQHKTAKMQRDLKANIEKRERERRIVKEAKALQNQKKMNQEKIFYLEKERDLTEQQLRFLISIQNDYYLRILKKGDESRSHGLIWVIETLSETGTIVTDDMLPDFLDFNAKKFLINLSLNDRAIKKKEQEIKKLIRDWKVNTSEPRGELQRSLNRINSGLRSIKSGMSISKLQTKIVDQNIKQQMEKIQDEIDLLREKIKDSKRAEAERLVREIRNPKSKLISDHNKGRDIQKILKAMFGESKFYKEVALPATKKKSIHGFLPSKDQKEDIIQYLTIDRTLRSKQFSKMRPNSTLQTARERRRAFAL